MARFNQPPLNSSSGVMVTVGVVNTISGERSAMVFPLAEDNRPGVVADLGFDAFSAVEASIMGALLDCMSVDSEIRFIAAEPMMNGRLPFRVDYAAGVNPGTRGTPSVPDQVALLIVFYMNPNDPLIPPHNRLRIGKNYIPGAASADIVGDIVQGGVLANMDTLIGILGNGFVGVGADTGTWYRVVSQDRASNSTLVRSMQGESRRYVCTQRRRLLPH